MKTKITLIILLIVAGTSIIFFSGEKKTEIEKLRAQHAEYLKNHRFNETLNLSKAERKKLGIPPNKYFEEQSLLEMNPMTGRVEFEKKFALQEKLLNKNVQKNVPGSDDNAWIERGPTNMPGRTRAMLFDPNDSNGKRVFAGGVSGGLWVNQDITISSSPWTRIGIPENLAVSSITVDPNNSMIMYLGTGESYVGGRVNGNGIWKSTDGGASWSHIFGGSSGATSVVGNSQVEVNSPVNIQTTITSIQAGFGPGIISSITGNLVLVDDGTAAPTEGCNSLINGGAINGNIAVIERGSCNFTVKVKNAQDEGAVAVLVINNEFGNPITMGGSDPTVTIPSVMISKDEGATILTTMNSETVNITISDLSTELPVGISLIPGIFHINDIVARNNGGSTEIYAAVADAIYGESLPNFEIQAGSQYGLYRSTDGGTNWSIVTLSKTANGNRYVPNDIEISSDNTIWLSTTNSSVFGDGGGTIFSSVNGTTFTERQVIAGGFRTEIEVSESNPDKIYVLTETATVNISRTTDGFTTLETLTLPEDIDESVPATDFTRGQAFYDLMLEADPTNDEIVYVGGINSFRSDDGGTTWVKMSQQFDNAALNVPIVHADIHELLFDPSSSDKAIIATDGGVYYANSLVGALTSRSAIFSNNNGYNTTQYYWGSIGQDQTNDQLLAGAQDNGTNFINNGTNGLNTSSLLTGGDGAYCFVDKDGDYLITSTQFLRYFRLNLPNPDQGGIEIVNDGSDSGSFINPADLDDNLDILYVNASNSSTFRLALFNNLLTSSPDRRNFSNALLTSSPTVIKVSPFTTDATNLFVGTETGQILKLEGADTTFPTTIWTDISGPEFVGSISAINFGNNEDEIMVTFHNYGVKNIWYTADGGATWQNKEGDFPDIPVKAILMNPLLNNEVIIGTDLGVWRTANFNSSDPTWVQSINGMQNVKVTSFDLRTSDNTVLATTYGRGMFTGKFTDIELSVEEISSRDDRITLYPNPSDGNIKIRTTIDFGISKISIYDINGRLIHSEDKTIFETTDLNLSNLKSGLYTINILSEDFSYNKKFFIEYR